ncbi:AAA family ATPase [Aeromonas dhakensis]|uniref:AAA family ATPase n=1 Tax=Aeromonas dhakensis TaxID=196024 RepID=UPI0009B7A906|nr:AAA family ATPase [Aeromonas dhakensis]
MKRILITGVFASGKTSLIDLLRTTLEYEGEKVVVINEVARQCPFDLNKSQSLMSTSWLVMAQIKNEITQPENTCDYIIFDRGLPDIIAHTKYVLNDNHDELIFFDMLESLSESSLKSYDYVFLSMSSSKFKIDVDEIRVADVEYQKKLENIHINHLDKIKANYILLKEDNHERLQQILEKIV